MSEKSAAVLTIHRAADMTPEGRASVVAWLRRQARLLARSAPKLSRRYTARYLYR